MAIFLKSITDYLDGKRDKHSHVNDSPATTFLKEVVEICDSIHHCKRSFARKKDGNLTKDGEDAFQRIVTSSFSFLMSHFEMFQKAQFSALLNSRTLFAFADDLEVARRLEKVGCNVTLTRVLAGGGEYGDTGEIIADALPGWHDPERVNEYFRTLLLKHSLFSNDICAELQVLWQLRHSIVHTGGVVSAEDAMKRRELGHFKGCELVVGEGFMLALGRRFHIMLDLVMTPLRRRLAEVVIPLKDDTQDEIDHLLDGIAGCASPRKSWFRRSEA